MIGEWTMYTYIDESGSLAAPHCSTVTLAAVKTPSPKALRWIVKRAMRGMQRKKSKRGRPSELKFHNATDNARAEVLEALSREQVEVYALSVFKGAQIIPHTPENYGILLCELLRMCGAEHEHVAELVVDMPFNTLQQRARLTAIVRDTLDLDVEPRYVDSVQNSYVQLADFVVGADECQPARRAVGGDALNNHVVSGPAGGVFYVDSIILNLTGQRAIGRRTVENDPNLLPTRSEFTQ